MAANFYLTVQAIRDANESNLSPVPTFAPSQFSMSQNGGGTLNVTFQSGGSTVQLSGYAIEMLIDTPSFPPGFGPFGVANVFQIKVPMAITGNTAYVSNFSPFYITGPYTLNFYLYGSPNYTTVPTILVVTV